MHVTLRGNYIGRHLQPMHRVIAEVARTVGLKPDDITGKDNRRLPSRARQMAMIICRDYVGASYPQIGAVFQRDHSTVIYNVNRASEIMQDDDWDDLEAIAKQCGLVQEAAQ